MQLHHFHRLHVVLDIIPNPNQLLNLAVHRLPQPSHLRLNSRAVVEYSVVAHELLDFEDVLDLLEVGGGFLGDQVEVLFGVEQKSFGVLVALVYLFDVEGEVAEEVLDFPLSVGLEGLAVGSPAAVGADPSEFDDIVALAGQHDGALLAVEQLLMRFGMVERMRGSLFLVVEADLPRASWLSLFDLRRGPEVGVIVILSEVPGVCVPHIRY